MSYFIRVLDSTSGEVVFEREIEDDESLEILPRLPDGDEDFYPPVVDHLEEDDDDDSEEVEIDYEPDGED